MSKWLLRMAVLYLFVGVVLGNVMGAGHDYTLRPLHAHLNLLGFVVMFLAGLWYRAEPAASASRLAKAHFWIHQIVYPIQMLMLALYLGGNTAVDPVLGITSMLMALAILCFGLNVWKYARN